MKPHNIRVVALIGIVLLAGCGGLGGLIGGDESLTFTAKSVSVADSEMSSSDFAIAADKPIEFERNFEIQDQSKTVKMKAYMLHLTRSYKGAPLGHVVILSLPQVSVLGQQIDVAEQIEPMDLIGRAQGSATELERQQKIGERSVQVLSGKRTVEIYRGTVEQADTTAKVRIYIISFSHKEDSIIAVGIIPVEAQKEGTEEILSVFQHIQHG